jgi:hypothetical protein
MLPLHYLSDDLHSERLARAETLRPGRRQLAQRKTTRRARRVGQRTLLTVRRAFQLRG